MGKKHRKLSHNECRLNVCIFCFSKANRPLSKGFKERFDVLKHDLEFDLSDSKTPAGICTSCQKKYAEGNGGFGIASLVHKNFDFIVLPPDYDKECNCQICLKARRPIIIHGNFGRFGNIRAGVPRTSPKLRAVALNVDQEVKSGPKMSFCRECHSEVPTWKFKTHPCTNKIFAENLYKQTGQGKKRKAAEAYAIKILETAERSPKGQTRMLSQGDGGGRKKNLVIGKAKVRSPREKMRVETLTKLARTHNTSQSGIKGYTAAINASFKKGSIEKNYTKKLRALYTKYDDDIVTSDIVVNGKTYPLVHINNLSEYILDLSKDRDVILKNQILRTSCDAGQTRTSFSFSLIDKDEDEDIPKGYKSSGVNKMHGFAVTKAKECHELLEIVLEKVGFYKCRFKFVGDLAVINPFCGLLKIPCCWPCYACEVHRDDLAGEGGKPRTVGSLLKAHEKYEQTLLDGNKVEAKDPEFKGGRDRPLLLKKGENDAFTLSKKVFTLIPPPVMHCMLGIVADIHKCACQQWPEGIKLWCIKIKVWPDVTEHPGGPRNRFQGADCCKLLNNVWKLELWAIRKGKIDLMQPFIDALDCFNRVRNSCFGKHLHPYYRIHIDAYWNEMKNLNRKFGLSITPKMHVIYVELMRWCNKYGIGLGLHTEGPHESFHSKLNKAWLRRKASKYDVGRWRKAMRNTLVYVNSAAESDRIVPKIRRN